MISTLFTLFFFRLPLYAYLSAILKWLVHLDWYELYTYFISINFQEFIPTAYSWSHQELRFASFDLGEDQIDWCYLHTHIVDVVIQFLFFVVRGSEPIDDYTYWSRNLPFHIQISVKEMLCFPPNFFLYLFVLVAHCLMPCLDTIECSSG